MVAAAYTTEPLSTEHHLDLQERLTDYGNSADIFSETNEACRLKETADNICCQ